ncbi:ABC transporter ATP-binding protein [Candidatus Stoquefichus sp. SB1]|jgi:branched-chain amino acid transport system ATP-binding protein|uniref:ABC transporter ATP-binding protein n=1 Tax=Candidatus Stoquefichus sp. SB1 TaxID=1658109 RepID=UPI00067E93E1|nr:ABC transporter ATP-binding protein [Candidatus Stoquefichus sp. SB1]
MSLLKTEGLGIQFGGLKAVDEFNFEIDKNQLFGLIGPNGAGKTTVFNLLTGVYKPTSGQIMFDGKSLLKMSPTQITQFGIARTFQNIRLFKDMTVLDNVKVGLHHSQNYSLLSSIVHTPKYFKGEEAMEEMALSLLRVFDLEQFAHVKASNLPYGKQRKLEIARALATSPKLLLLDEPAAGMNPTETAELMETIKIVREKFAIAILLIEHDMKLVMGICEKIAVLNFGTVLAFGTPEEIRNNPDVVAAYLGNDE